MVESSQLSAAILSTASGIGSRFMLFVTDSIVGYSLHPKPSKSERRSTLLFQTL
jgi:hypothetical protein